MSSVRKGEVSFVTDGKETVQDLYEHMERLAYAFGRVRDWPVCELGAVRVTPARWGGFYNVRASVSLSGPDIGEGE